MHGVVWAPLFLPVGLGAGCKDVQAGLCQAWVLEQLLGHADLVGLVLMQVSGQWAGRRGRTFGLQLPTAREGRCPDGRARHSVDLIMQLRGGGRPASEGRRAVQAGA